MPRLKLLIADDESHIRSGLAKLVDWEKLGYEISGTFSDGQDVLNYLKDHEADVLLSDIVMLKVSGLDCAAWIAKNRPHMRVLLLTSYSEFRYAQEALNLGVYHFFTKPLDLSELTSTFSALRAQLKKDEPAEDAPLSPGDHTLLFSSLENYLKDNLAQGITLENAAQFVHLSPSYLSRLFKHAKGQRFSDYVFSLRIETAKNLLIETDLLVYEIAEQVGWRDVRHFIAAFKNETGRTPSNYRRHKFLHPEGEN